jgi:hypothetical protein
MAAPQTALVDDVTELLILWPHLTAALERDQGAAGSEKVSGDPGTFGLPVNADVLEALRLLTWTCRYSPSGRPASSPNRTSAGPSTTTYATSPASMSACWSPRRSRGGTLAVSVHAMLRQVKLAVGLRTVDRRLGQFCPLHDDPLRELIAPGDEGVLRYRPRSGRPADRARCRVAPFRLCAVPALWRRVGAEPILAAGSATQRGGKPPYGRHRGRRGRLVKRLVPVAVAAAALGVTPPAVRQMFRRGKLTRHGTLQRALVDLTECEDMRLGEAA